EDGLRLIDNLFKHGLIIMETVGLLANHVFDSSLACRNYLSARYTQLYVDEYQDAGYDQHKLFLKLKDLGLRVMAVGDSNQSIYEYSGRSSEYLKLLTQDKGFKNFRLTKNHRCDQSIINYSNFLLDPKTTILPVVESRMFFK